MSRLYDRVITDCTTDELLQVDAFPFLAHKRLCDQPCEVFSLDNAVEYYYEVSDKPEGEDAINVAPPFERFFIESHPPLFIRSGKEVIPWPKTLGAWGMFVEAHEFADEEQAATHIRELLADAKDQHGQPLAPGLPKVLPRWYTQGWLYSEDKYYPRPYGPFGLHFCYVEPSGSACGQANGEPFSHLMFPFVASEDEMNYVVGQYGKLVRSLEFGLSLLHCKNVVLAEHSAPRHERRRFAREHGHSAVVYKTLEIEPMKRVLRTEGRAEEVGLKKALHICRGHFKTYTEEKPLFGKKTGTYWWPQHLKGTKERGEVVKDYSVKSPQP